MDEIPDAQSGNGFDKMRTMLARAAEVRADEQRHIYDILDEVRARLTPVESFVAEGHGRLPTLTENVASVAQRLNDLPDRTEISVIAERLDEALARIDGQDSVLAQVITAMNNLSERMGRPLDALEARLDGVAGRFEGVAGRLDGLDDRLLHLHGRLDDLETTLTSIQATVESMPERLDIGAVHTHVEQAAGSVRQHVQDEMATVHTRLEDLVGRPAVDPSERLDDTTSRIQALTDRLESVAGRVDSVEDSVRTGIGTLSGAVDQGIDKLETTVSSRPDREEVTRTLRSAQSESERRITQQLDQALAAFAEVMLGQSTKGSAIRAGGRMAGKKSAGDDLAE